MITFQIRFLGVFNEVMKRKVGITVKILTCITSMKWIKPKEFESLTKTQACPDSYNVILMFRHKIPILTTYTLYETRQIISDL